MSKFMMVYLGGNQPKTPEEGQKHFEKYKQWLSSMGDKVISPANPLKNTHVVGPDGSVRAESSTLMSGYTIVEADSIEDAVELSKSCPFLEIGGTLEISELVEMSFSN